MILAQLRTGLGAVAFMALTACAATPEDGRAARNAERARVALERGAEILAKCQETRCEELILISASLEDYTILNDMQHITRLTIQNQTFETLTDISGMTQLASLHVGSTRLMNLEGLPAFVNLTELQTNGRLTNISPPLSQMTRLRRLQIHFDVSDIDFVAKLTNLRTLHIEGNEITDIAPLSGHPSLEMVNVQRIGLPDDLSAFLDMPALRELRLGAVFSDGIGRQRDEDALWAQLRSRGVEVVIFPGSFTPEIMEPPRPEEP